MPDPADPRGDVGAGFTPARASSNEAAATPPDMEGIEIEILPGGTVRFHARCQPGQDPAECAARVRALVEALGVDPDAVETEISPTDP